MSINHDIIFRLKAKNETGQGVQDAKAEVENAAKSVSSGMSNIVPAAANEGLETLAGHQRKLSTLMRMLGGDIGAQSAEVTKYAGKISGLLTGGFTPWEIGIVAVTAVLGGLVAILNQASESSAYWDNHLENTRKLTKELSDEIEGLATAVRHEMESISGAGVPVEKAWVALETRKILFRDLVRQIDEHSAKANDPSTTAGDWGKAHKILLDRRDALKTEMEGLDRELVRAREVQALELNRKMDLALDKQNQDELEKIKSHNAKVAEEQAKSRAAELKKLNEFHQAMFAESQSARAEEDSKYFHTKFLRVTKDGEYEVAMHRNSKALAQDATEWTIKENERLAAEEAKIRADTSAEMIRIENNKFKQEQAVWKMEDKAVKDQDKARRENIKAAYDLAQQTVDAGLQVVKMYDLFGEASAKTEEERAKAAAKSAAFTAGIQMAMEIARGAAAFASQNYWEGAQHMIAAALFGAAMGKALSDMSGSGVAAGGESAAGTTAERHRFEEASGGNEEKAKEAANSSVIIYVYGHQIFGSDADKMFSKAVTSYNAQQNPGASQARF